VRALMHRAYLGDPPSAKAARLLAEDIDNPALRMMLDAAQGVTADTGDEAS
jgi:hypothetical protein